MLKKIISLFLSLSLIITQPIFAQGVAQLNLAQYLGQARLSAIDNFRPAQLRYFSYDNLNNSFRILLDKGDVKDIKDNQLKEQAKELMDYFLIGLVLPNDAFWVNLRPDSPDNIIDPELEKTGLGRILLEADLQLKKDTAGLTSPQTPEGKAYWDKLYKKAGELFGTENITIPTITRPWIVPGEIIVRESGNSAYIYKATLKVLLEQDYLKDSAVYNFSDPRLKELNEYSSQIIRETIIPKLTQEVNSSKRYAQLRQVYYSLVLSRWFKQKFGTRAPEHQSLSADYISLIDSGNLTNLIAKEPYDKLTYFKQYQESFAKGEYNLKETVYTPYGQSIRTYMSGGFNAGNKAMIISGVGTTVGSSIVEESFKNHNTVALEASGPHLQIKLSQPEQPNAIAASPVTKEEVINAIKETRDAGFNALKKIIEELKEIDSGLFYDEYDDWIDIEKDLSDSKLFADPWSMIQVFSKIERKMGLVHDFISRDIAEGNALVSNLTDKGEIKIAQKEQRIYSVLERELAVLDGMMGKFKKIKTENLRYFPLLTVAEIKNKAKKMAAGYIWLYFKPEDIDKSGDSIEVIMRCLEIAIEELIMGVGSDIKDVESTDKIISTYRFLIGELREHSFAALPLAVRTVILEIKTKMSNLLLGLSNYFGEKYTVNPRYEELQKINSKLDEILTYKGLSEWIEEARGVIEKGKNKFKLSNSAEIRFADGLTGPARMLSRSRDGIEREGAEVIKRYDSMMEALNASRSKIKDVIADSPASIEVFPVTFSQMEKTVLEQVEILKDIVSPDEKLGVENMMVNFKDIKTEKELKRFLSNVMIPYIDGYIQKRNDESEEELRLRNFKSYNEIHRKIISLISVKEALELIIKGSRYSASPLAIGEIKSTIKANMDTFFNDHYKKRKGNDLDEELEKLYHSLDTITKYEELTKWIDKAINFFNKAKGLYEKWYGTAGSFVSTLFKYKKNAQEGTKIIDALSDMIENLSEIKEEISQQEKPYFAGSPLGKKLRATDISGVHLRYVYYWKLSDGEKNSLGKAFGKSFSEWGIKAADRNLRFAVRVNKANEILDVVGVLQYNIDTEKVGIIIVPQGVNKALKIESSLRETYIEEIRQGARFWDNTSSPVAGSPVEEFITGGVNSKESIKNLKGLGGRIIGLFETPPRPVTYYKRPSIGTIEEHARPGGYSESGVLSKTDSLIEIMIKDNIYVLGKGLTHQILAAPLFKVLNCKKNDTKNFEYNGKKFSIQIKFVKKIYSIFNDDRWADFQYTVKNKDSDETITFSGLLPYYIHDYGFYGGNVAFRLEPQAIIDFFGITASSGLTSESRPSMPFGGIDFTSRAMRIGLEPMGSFADLKLVLPEVANATAIDLDNEFKQIQLMASSGIRPSDNRILEFAAACYYRGEFGARLGEITACLQQAHFLDERLGRESSEALRLATMLPEVL